MKANAAAAAAGGAAAGATPAAKVPKLSEQAMAPCASCGGSPVALPEAEAASKLAQLCPSWSVGVSQGGESQLAVLRRSFVAKNFASALAALNAYGAVAEEQGHHPDLHLTSYRTVTIELYTHSIDSLSQNDFILAALLDKCPVVYSPKWQKENPSATAGTGK